MARRRCRATSRKRCESVASIMLRHPSQEALRARASRSAATCCGIDITAVSAFQQQPSRASCETTRVVLRGPAIEERQPGLALQTVGLRHRARRAARRSNSDIAATCAARRRAPRRAPRRTARRSRALARALAAAPPPPCAPAAPAPATATSHQPGAGGHHGGARRLVDIAQDQSAVDRRITPPAVARGPARAARTRWRVGGQHLHAHAARGQRSAMRLRSGAANSSRQRWRCDARGQVELDAMAAAARTAAPPSAAALSSGSVSSSTMTSWCCASAGQRCSADGRDAARIGQHAPGASPGAADARRGRARQRGRRRRPAARAYQRTSASSTRSAPRAPAAGVIGGFAQAAAQRRDAVAVAHRRPRRDGAGARGLHRLEAHARAEIQRRRGVGDDQRQALALGLEQLGVRRGRCARSGASRCGGRRRRCDVLARLRVLHAAPAQRRQRMSADAVPAALRRARRPLATPRRATSSASVGTMPSRRIGSDVSHGLARPWAQGSGTCRSSSRDQAIAVPAFGRGFVAGQHAMAQHVGRDRAHVVGRDEIAAGQPGVRARATFQRDRAARARAPGDAPRQCGVVALRHRARRARVRSDSAPPPARRAGRAPRRARRTHRPAACARAAAARRAALARARSRASRRISVSAAASG